jgi:LmbE family N-acetylglucosaminyl deacetylase
VLAFQPVRAIRTLLCLGAHSDDIEIGCGGTVLRLLAQFPAAMVYWVVLSAADPARAAEAEAGARLFLGDDRPSARIVVERFPDGFLPFAGGDLKARLEALRREVDPDLILTHRRDDAHQDHRQVAELTWQTFRDHFILEYEIPKYDGDLTPVNFFVELDGATVERKIAYLMASFASQRSKDWYTEDTFRALLRLRGIECRSASGYAEGFHCRKLVLG